MAEEVNMTNNGLILYYYATSYYSQRVVMALHEKKIPFTPKLINPYTLEQNKPWFLKINPKGQVPVLQDGMKFVPDSNDIIDYLDDNFSDRPRLFPRDVDSDSKKKIQHFRELIESVPAFPLTFGSIFNPEYIEKPKYPLNVPAYRNKMKSVVLAMPNTLRDFTKAEDYPEELKVIVEQKANNMELQLPRLRDKIVYQSVLDGVAKVLDEIETELGSHIAEKSDWWLCSNHFTVADIYLAILLNRLNAIGLDSHGWKNGRRPHIEQYFYRMQLRESFVATTTIPKLAFLSEKTCSPVLSLILAFGVLVSAYFLYKRFK